MPLLHSVDKCFPHKLKAGDKIAVVAPARSLSLISKETQEITHKRFADLDLSLTFGKHVNKIDDFSSSSIESRIEDLHVAFSNPDIKAIITVIGGFNSNQLLSYLNWHLIQNNPKILCGFSDITVLNNAIFAKTGLVTYSGPHYSSFGQKLYFDYTLDYFKKCLFSNQPYQLEPSEYWSDDEWYKNQDDRTLIKNEGFLVINEGSAEGTILGGNLSTFRLLQGTKYFPNLSNSVLFIEDDYEVQPHHFDRELQALIHAPEFMGVKGIVIGRFQHASNMTNNLLVQIIKTKKELQSLPVIANIDFGHTDSKITFPIGGTAFLTTKQSHAQITIINH